MFIFKRARPASYLRKNTAAQNAALARLGSFLDTSTPQLVYFLHQMFQDQQTAITYKELREAWLDGYEQEIRQWQEDYARFVEDRLSPMWEIAMWNGAQQIIERLKERGILVYDDSDHDVRSWLQRHTGEFITNIGEGTRQAVRSIVMHGQAEGWTSDQMARAIRPCIGLTQPQAMANLKYQQHVYETLLESHPRMKAEAAARKAQDAALKYAAKQHRIRASTIADTELAYAYNMGAHESVRQAMKQNLMGPCEKVWSTAADARVCEKCRALAGKRIGFDEGFPGGNRVAAGYDVVPPAHPRCRCVVEYVEISAPVIKPLNVGGANGTIGTRNTTLPARNLNCDLCKGIGQTYYEKARDMLEASPNIKAAGVWARFEDQIKVGNSMLTGKAYHSGGQLFFDIAKVAAGDSCHKPYQNLFHEGGHCIDWLNRKTVQLIDSYGNTYDRELMFSAEYKDGAFAKAIHKDVNELIKSREKILRDEFKRRIQHDDLRWFFDNSHWMFDKNDGIIFRDYIIKHGSIPNGFKYKKEFTYRAIEQEIKDVAPKTSWGNISDILEGTTNGKISCGVGHKGKDPKYWKDRTVDWTKWGYRKVESGLSTEAFAEMIDSCIGNPESLELMQFYFQESYKVFEEMLVVLAGGVP